MEREDILPCLGQFESGRCFGVPLLEFVLCLGEVADFVSPRLFEHHLKVGYLAFRLGEAMELPQESRELLLLGGLLHDLGTFSLQERLKTLEFEFQGPEHHAFVGYLLLRDFPPFESLAKVVRFHHHSWDNGRGKDAPLESHVLHFADRVSITCSFREDPVGEALQRVAFFEAHVPQLFHPEVFSAFQKLLAREYVWLDLASPHLRRLIATLVPPGKLCLGAESFSQFSRLVAHLIDFRSSFTATHSAGVAQVARILGNLAGFSREHEEWFFASGLLHDLGKLAVPLEILEKPGPLTEREMRIMKSHAYYTFVALSWIQNLKDVTLWAAEHHERCDGKGYPFGRRKEELLLESRVMAVADVFTALAEDRPYRAAFSPLRVRETLADMARLGVLDEDVVGVLLEHFLEVYEACQEAQHLAAGQYAAFRQGIATFTS